MGGPCRGPGRSRGDYHGQQQAQRVHGDVPLRPFTFSALSQPRVALGTVSGPARTLGTRQVFPPPCWSCRISRGRGGVGAAGWDTPDQNARFRLLQPPPFGLLTSMMVTTQWTLLMLTGPNRDTWHVGFSYVSSVTKGPLIGSRTCVGSVGKSPVQVSGLETMSRSCHSPKFMPEPWIRHSIRPLAFVR